MRCLPVLLAASLLALAGCGGRRGAGPLAPREPVQVAIDGDALEIERDGYRITPLAKYDITALVISKERYLVDRGADLAPLDLLLGWGPMSDPDVIERLSIFQSFRIWHWQAAKLPIPRHDIEQHAANVHCIAADAGVAGALDDLSAGDVVTLSGWLVEVASDDGWRWRTSLTRTDTGLGACELLYVRTVEVAR